MLQPVGPQANEGLLARLWHRITGSSRRGGAWYQLESGALRTLDAGAVAGTDVYSPVDGTVVAIRDRARLRSRGRRGDRAPPDRCAVARRDARERPAGSARSPWARTSPRARRSSGGGRHQPVRASGARALRSGPGQQRLDPGLPLGEPRRSLGSPPALRILFIADVVGAPGRSALDAALPGLREELGVDVVRRERRERRRRGRDHASPRRSRSSPPAQTRSRSETTPSGARRSARTSRARTGSSARRTPRAPRRAGLAVVPTANGARLAVVNVLGSLFLDPATSMFEVIDELVDAARRETPLVLVDVHAEATSEKVALARWLDGRVTAVVGTHTHVQTSDAHVLPKRHGVHHRRRHDRAARLGDRRRVRARDPAHAHGDARALRDGSGRRADRGRGHRLRRRDRDGLVDRRGARLRPLIAAPGRSKPERDEREHPRQVEVEPVGQRELEGDEDRRRQRGQLDRALLVAGRTRRRRREPPRARRATGCTNPRSGIPSAWYWPQPQSENG